jgi:hypothetical protein
MTYAFFGIGFAIVAFIWWRYTSVARGARQRNLKIFAALNPIEKRFAAKEPVTADEIAQIAKQPQYRWILYHMMKHFERLDLFPTEHLSIVGQGEGYLAYWMMHPNELQSPPSEIELIESFDRNVNGTACKFLVYRFRMAEGHWAAKDGWLLGVAGPFVEGDAPYSGLASSFSRTGDKDGITKPSELVDWFVGMMTKKGAPLPSK